MFYQTLLLFQEASAELEREVGTQSFFDIITKGGILGILIVLVLFALSVIALYIFVERYLTIKRAGRVDESFINNIRANVSAGNIQGAKALCASTDSPVARMVEKGLQRIGKPLRDIDAAIEPKELTTKPLSMEPMLFSFDNNNNSTTATTYFL